MNKSKQGMLPSACSYRCSFTNVIWSLIAWIMLVQIYHSLFPAANAVGRLRGIARNQELDQSEEFPIFPPVRMPKSKKGRRKLKPEGSRNELSLERKAFYFPHASLAMDPLNSSEEDKYYFYPGREWHDSEGKPIQAHGGGILYVPESGVFYWYGENKDGRTYHLSKRSPARVDLIGISCYSSKDLWIWKHEGVVLKAENLNKLSDLFVGNVMERPKVIYNDNNKQYVMWMHVDSANYSKASVGVAVSSRPEGPFEYLGSTRPHGFDSRDMTVFKDDDGVAYLIYSSLSNSELHISPLDAAYLGLQNKMSTVLVHQRREAPAVLKHQGIYYMITSGCTGWGPNPSLVHAAERMMGPWETLGDPCVGATEEFRSTTFYSQGSFVLPLPGLNNTYIFIADRWNPSDLRDSRYVWLPLIIGGPIDAPFDNNLFEFPLWLRVSIRWHMKWKLPLGWNNSLAAADL